MKLLISILAILQLLTVYALCGLSNELNVARQSSISTQVEIQQLRQEMKYLTHPETVQIRYLEYVMKVGEFK